ncbi:MAG: hypothetical protein ACI4OI_03330 [Gemmiger sp.]
MALTASDFTGLHLQYKSVQAEGELPCAIEHDFADGRMVDHYFVTPSPAFWQDEGVKSLGEVSGLLFLQQPNGAPWQILVHEKAMLREVVFELEETEFRRLLADNGVILPGEPGFQPPH